MHKFCIAYSRNKKTKTYYPPSIKLFDKMNDKLFLSYLIGFIDGDGSISKKIRNGNTITITAHVNWGVVLQKWRERMELIFKIKLSDKAITKDKDCYRFHLYKKEIILGLKDFICKENLNVNNIKWGRI